MISHEDIRQLQQFSFNADSCVLSVYIDVDQSKAANLNRGFVTAAENILRGLYENEAVEANGKRSKFYTERDHVLGYLGQYSPKGKGLVIFSDSSRNFWWDRELKVMVPSGARWSPHLWLRPLLDIIEEREKLGVVIIDKHRAKILTVEAGDVEKHADVTSEVPQRHQTTGRDHLWSQGQMDRDHIKHIKWHAKQATLELASIVDRMKLTRIVVGGPVEATTIFMDELPKRYQQMVIATLPVPIDISPDKLVSEINSVREKTEQEDEVRLVESLVTAARKGDRAVIGIADTLSAIQEGRVYRLVVDKSYHTIGRQCITCSLLLADEVDKCPFCKGAMAPAPDLINRASQKVLEQGGKVKTISGQASGKLRQAGSIGALLRF